MLTLSQGKAKAEAKTCGETALYIAASYYWHTDRHDKARDLVDRLLKLNPNSQVYVVDDLSVGCFEFTNSHHTVL